MTLYPVVIIGAAVGLSALANGATIDSSRQRFSSLVVFGDSFSDDSNGTWKLTNNTWPADPAYFSGRFSDGPVWPEYLAKQLGSLKLYDNAYGGATIDNTIIPGFTGPASNIPVPAVADQVRSFLANTPQRVVSRTALVALVAGINDGFFAGDELDVRALTNSLVNSLRLLVQDGFRNFILPKTQAGTLLPYYILYTDSATITKQDQFSKDFKGNLTLSLNAVKSQFPRGVKVHLWDETAAIAKVIQRPGLETVQPCLAGAYGEAPRTLCADASEYVFFDVFHPTTGTHKAIAKSMAQLL